MTGFQLLRERLINCTPRADSKVREGKGAYGYNAAADRYEDLVRAGVIDPAKVVRVALQNAASVAALMLTTEAAIAVRSSAPPDDD